MDHFLKCRIIVLCMDTPNAFTSSPTEGHFGCFFVLAVLYKAAVNICVQVFVCIWTFNTFGKCRGFLLPCLGKAWWVLWEATIWCSRVTYHHQGNEFHYQLHFLFVVCLVLANLTQTRVTRGKGTSTENYLHKTDLWACLQGQFHEYWLTLEDPIYSEQYYPWANQ